MGAAGQAHGVPLVPGGTLAVWPCWLWTQVGGRQWAWRAEVGVQAAPGGSVRGGQMLGGRGQAWASALLFKFRSLEQKTRVLLGQKASLPRRIDGLSSRQPRLTGPAGRVPQCHHVVCALRSVLLGWGVRPTPCRDELAHSAPRSAAANG